MKSRYYFLLGGVLVLVAVAVFWLLQPQGLSHYQDLLAQQEFDRARTALTQELAEKPHWHEARTLLAEVELAAGQPLAALEQILLLWEGDWDTEALEERFLELLPPGQGEAALALLAGQPHSLKPARLALGIALKVGSAELIASKLVPMSKLHRGHPLVAQAWSHLKAKDPVAAWRIADELNPSFKKKLLGELKFQAKLADFLAKLLAADSQAANQLISEAKEWGGMEGLELLLAMEKTGWDPRGLTNYPHVKLDLMLAANLDRVDRAMLNHISWDVVKNKVSYLLQEEEENARPCLYLLMALEEAGFAPGDEQAYANLKLELLKLTAPAKLNPSFLAGIKKSELLSLAKDWVEYSAWDEEVCPPETIVALLDYLGQDSKYRDKVALLKAITLPPPEPEPQRIFMHELRRDQGQLEFWEVSPCGRHVLYSGWNTPTTYWFDLDKNEHVAEFAQSLYGVWDQRGKVALLPRDGDTMYVYDTDSAAKLAEFPWAQATALGWQDGRLLLANSQRDGYQVEALDPATGERKPLLTAPVLPSLSQDGKLGYLIQIGSSVQVVLDGKAMNFSGSWSSSPWKLHSWLPGDRGVVLGREGEYAILSFADGAFLPLPIEEFVPHPLGWLDQYRVAGTCNLGGKAVLIVDIRDMSWTHTGISWHYNGQLAGPTAYRFQDGNLIIFTLE